MGETRTGCRKVFCANKVDEKCDVRDCTNDCGGHCEPVGLSERETVVLRSVMSEDADCDDVDYV